jgi:Sec-independent protein translocase protein TatA
MKFFYIHTCIICFCLEPKTSDLAKSLGSSIREFKNATKELDDIS